MHLLCVSSAHICWLDGLLPCQWRALRKVMCLWEWGRIRLHFVTAQLPAQSFPCRMCLTNDNRRARKKHRWGCHSQAGMEALRVENSSFGWAYLTWEILGENHPVFPLHLYKVKLYLDQLWLNFLLRIFFSKLFFTFFVKAEPTLLLNMLTKDISICYGNHVSSLRYF